MDVRKATPDDTETIASIASASLLASYVPPLSAGIVDDAVDAWYDRETVEESLATPTREFLVAETGEGVVGFAQGAVAEEGIGVLEWLHVHPDHRGEGVGDALFDAVREALEDHGIDRLRGLVLVGNDDGVAFYEDRGFERREEREIEIEGEPHIEYVYEVGGAEDLPLEAVRTDGGRTVYVAPEEIKDGSDGYFQVVYTTRSRENRWGFRCECGSLDNAMDSMGRIQCTDCGNTRRPARWDAAYL